MQLGFQQRQFSMGESASWRRFDAAWSGTLAPRLHAYASASDVEYHGAAAARRFVGDAALSFAVNDSLKISGGGGRLAVDAFHAARNAVTAPFFYGNVLVEPWRMTAIEAQYSRYLFSNGVARDRFTVEGFRRVGAGRALHVDVGGAGSWMWHDRETAAFFSPTAFHSLLAKARVAGRLSPAVEYSVEAGAGEQREAGYGRQSPFVVTGMMFARLGPRLHLRIEAGRSTSSLETDQSGAGVVCAHGGGGGAGVPVRVGLRLLTLLRSFLNQFLGHEDKTEELRPLRHDVSNYFPPLRFGIHLQVEEYPAHSRNHQEDGQRMVPDSLEETVPEAAARLSALRRADFVEVLCECRSR